MAHQERNLALVIALGMTLNLVGCAQTGTTQPGTATRSSAYQQEQKMLWNTAPQGSGQSTDWGLYMEEEGGG